jgi:hypothetical protein
MTRTGGNPDARTDDPLRGRQLYFNARFNETPA